MQGPFNCHEKYSMLTFGKSKMISEGLNQGMLSDEKNLKLWKSFVGIIQLYIDCGLTIYRNKDSDVIQLIRNTPAVKMRLFAVIISTYVM